MLHRSFVSLLRASESIDAEYSRDTSTRTLRLFAEDSSASNSKYKLYFVWIKRKIILDTANEEPRFNWIQYSVLYDRSKRLHIFTPFHLLRDRVFSTWLCSWWRGEKRSPMLEGTLRLTPYPSRTNPFFRYWIGKMVGLESTLDSVLISGARLHAQRLVVVSKHTFRNVTETWRTWQTAIYRESDPLFVCK